MEKELLPEIGKCSNCCTDQIKDDSRLLESKRMVSDVTAT